VPGQASVGPRSIGRRAEQHDAEGPIRKGLLLLDVAIHGDEGIEASACPLQQLAILETLPPQPADSLNVVARQ